MVAQATIRSSSSSDNDIGVRLFADWREQVTEVQENHRDEFVVQLPLRHGSVRIECDGGVLFDGDVRPGLMRVLAPGERVRVVRRSAAEGVALTIPGPVFRRIADEQGFTPAVGGLSLVAPAAEADPRVERLGWLLGSAPEIDSEQRPLFVEGVTLALLAVALSGRRAEPDGPAGCLTDAQLASCRAYAESRIGSRLDLASWAQVVGMTPGEFTRRFRCTTQASPYAWFLDRRIEAAKLLLSRADTTLATVALDVGFSSQSHFTEVFRRRVGLSPGRWRKAVLS
jgi:AraC family transcriptional regulator